MANSYTSKLCKPDSYRKVLMGTDMDYESAMAIGEWIVANMPYHKSAPTTLDSMPERLCGYPTKWVMEVLAKAGAVEFHDNL